MPTRRQALVTVAVLAAAAVAVAVVLLAVPGPGASGPGSSGASGRLASERPLSADAFLDSVGVNIHSTYSDTAYGDREAVQRALRELGVRHVRDGYEPARPDQRNYLGALEAEGIRTTFIMGAPNADVVSGLDAEGRRFLAATSDALEGPNEYDVAGDPDWAEGLRAYQARLFEAAGADPELADRPVLGPSFVERDSREEIGDLSGVLDAANLHPYPAGGPPEDNLEDEIASVRALAGSKPVVATETGYHDALEATRGQPPASERAAAIYLPRLLLEYHRLGIRRTFLYELVDERADPARADPEQHFGLVRSDFSPKPSYRAVQALMDVLSEPAAGGGEATALRYALDGASDDVRQVLLARGDVHYLALWQPVSVWDQARRRDVEPDPEPVTVRLEEPAAEVEVFRPSVSAEPARRLADVQEVGLELAGDVTLLRLGSGE